MSIGNEQKDKPITVSYVDIVFDLASINEAIEQVLKAKEELENAAGKLRRASDEVMKISVKK